MRTLKIGRKNYKLEYSFEAAYNRDCVSEVIDLMEMTDLGEQSGVEVLKEKFSNLPHLVTDLFSAGLLEHHEEDVENAKDILKQYFRENPSESFMSFPGVIIDCMSDDGFLQLIGLVDSAETKEVAETAEVKEFPMNNPVEETAPTEK